MCGTGTKPRRFTARDASRRISRFSLPRKVTLMRVPCGMESRASSSFGTSLPVISREKSSSSDVLTAAEAVLRGFIVLLVDREGGPRGAWPDRRQGGARRTAGRVTPPPAACRG
jgi:hypothetical protein